MKTGVISETEAWPENHIWCRKRQLTQTCIIARVGADIGINETMDYLFQQG